MTTADKLMQRYEEMRQLCLRYANFHPDDKSVCHQSLMKAPGHLPAVTVQLASLLDDMALAINTRPSGVDAEKLIAWAKARWDDCWSNGGMYITWYEIRNEIKSGRLNHSPSGHSPDAGNMVNTGELDK